MFGVRYCFTGLFLLSTSRIFSISLLDIIPIGLFFSVTGSPEKPILAIILKASFIPVFASIVFTGKLIIFPALSMGKLVFLISSISCLFIFSTLQFSM